MQYFIYLKNDKQWKEVTADEYQKWEGKKQKTM